MNSELEKLIEKYRITVNGLADLESGYDQVIKERGFVTLNGLLVSGEENTPAGESAEAHSPSGENTEVHNEPAAPAPVESAAAHSPSGEPTPVVPAPSVETATVVDPTPSEPAVENPGVTPVTDGPVSGDTNLGAEVASGESAEAHSPSGEERSEENTDAEEESSDEPAAGGKPKKKKK